LEDVPEREKRLARSSLLLWLLVKHKLGQNMKNEPINIMCVIQGPD
jgi:hypothetical protein